MLVLDGRRRRAVRRAGSPCQRRPPLSGPQRFRRLRATCRRRSRGRCPASSHAQSPPRTGAPVGAAPDNDSPRPSVDRSAVPGASTRPGRRPIGPPANPTEHDRRGSAAALTADHPAAEPAGTTSVGKGRGSLRFRTATEAADGSPRATARWRPKTTMGAKPATVDESQGTQRAGDEEPGARGARQVLPIGEIITDAGTQVRAEINEAIVEEYAEHLTAGGTLPPITAYRNDGSTYLGRRLPPSTGPRAGRTDGDRGGDPDRDTRRGALVRPGSEPGTRAAADDRRQEARHRARA